MKTHHILKTGLIVLTVGLLASCGSANKDQIRGGGQHVCSEARAQQAGLADYMNKNDYETDYAAKHKCPYDYQEINEAYHSGYTKGKAAMK